MGDKPVYMVGVAGLDPRDARLIEIVFRHSQYNKYEFRLAQPLDTARLDILIANPVEPEGLQAISQLRSAHRDAPVIAAVPRGAPNSAKHAISIDRLTLQLLPILNRVVELELLPQVPAAGAATQSPSSQSADRGAAPAALGSVGSAVGAAGTRETPRPGLRELAARLADVSAGASPPRDEPPLTAPSRTLAEAPTPARDEADTGVAPQAAASPDLASAQAAAEHEPAPQGAPRAGPSVQREQTPQASVSAGPQLSSPQSTSPQPSGPQPSPEEARKPPSNLVAFPISPVGEGAITQQLRVLVVDDSPTVRRQLTLAFDRMGIACECTESGAEALERLGEDHFDLALVDVVMPDMDGYRLTREIKRNRRLRQMPVIILTSRSSPFDLARGALAGCDTYLSKPVPFRALEAAVVKQLRRSLAIDDLTGLIRTSTELPASPAAPAPAAGPASRLAKLFGR
jgi:CheY-like chemotaxis protein